MAASEGVDLEWAIVEMTRARAGKQTRLTRSYSAKIKEQADKSVGHIIKKFGTKVDVFHSDERVPGIGPIYAKPEPKTDVVIFAGGKKFFVSVKMAGGIQLASGQGASTADLFDAAAKSVKTMSNRAVLTSIIKELRTMPTRLLSSDNLARLKEEGNAKLIAEFVKGGKILQDKSYDYWLEHNKPALMKSMLSYVQKNDEFFDAMLFEALTGKQTLATFKGAVANAIVSPSGFFEINPSYVQKLKPKIKIDLRAKSRGGITSIAFRIETRGSV